MQILDRMNPPTVLVQCNIIFQIVKMTINLLSTECANVNVQFDGCDMHMSIINMDTLKIEGLSVT